jgi:hypothetical protein
MCRHYPGPELRRKMALDGTLVNVAIADATRVSTVPRAGTGTAMPQPMGRPRPTE